MLTFIIYTFYIVYGLIFSGMFTAFFISTESSLLPICAAMFAVTVILHFFFAAKLGHLKTGNGRRNSDIPDIDLKEFARRKNNLRRQQIEIDMMKQQVKSNKV